MADEDAKSNDRSVSTLVEAGKTKSKKPKSKKRSNRNKIDYRVMVRCFIKFLTRVLKVCQENKIRHTDIASNVIPALLDVILHCKWNKVSPMYIDQVVTLLGHLSVVSEKETEWVVRDLIAVVKSPWRRPLITSMLHGVEDLKIDEVFDLLAKEGLLVVNRVRSLLENKLSKLCLNYLTWVYRCFTWDKRPIQNTISLPNKQFIFDIYIILLNDLKSIRDVFNVLKSFSNDEIMLMVDRLHNEHKRSDIALQVVNMLILKMSINVLESNEYILYSRLVKIFCEMSIRHNDNIADLKKQLNSVCKLTATSDHIYAIAQELFNQFPTNREVVTFVIELYIRGLTTDANALDKAKCVLKEPEIVRELGNKLSRVFQDVASVFPEYELRREFVLNAFCVNPCAETFKVLENVANDAPKPKPTSSLPDNCSWHTLTKSGTHLCFTCGGLFSHDDDNWVEEVPVFEEPDPTKLIDPQKTSFAPHLCDDLNVVLSSTRIQQLHWNLERNEMFTRCRNYIEQYKDLKLMLSKELEYLNIDYNQFKDLPGNNYADDPYAGVEKGYEHFIEFSEDEEEDDSEEEMPSDSSRNRNIARSRKSEDSQESRPRKFDSDSEDYVPPGRSRKPIDPNAPKAKLGRPKKIIENQPKPKIKIEKKHIVNPSVKTVKSAALIDLTKSDSNSSDEIFSPFTSSFGSQSRIPPVSTQTPQAPKYSAIIYPKSCTITTVTSSSIHHPLMTTTIAPVSSGSSHHTLMTSTTISPVSSGSLHHSLMTSTTIAPVSSVSLHHPLIASNTTASVSSGSLHHPLTTSSITVPVSTTIPGASSTLLASPVATTSASSNSNTVKSLRAFRPTIRKQEKTLYSAPLLSSTNLSSSQSHTSYHSSGSISTFPNSNQNVNIPLNRPVGNLNPGTLAMRNFLVQKYGNIQANIPVAHAQQVSLASTTLGSMAQNLSSTSTASTMQGTLGSTGLNLSTISTTIGPSALNLSSASTTSEPSSIYQQSLISTLGPSGYKLSSASTIVRTTAQNLTFTSTTIGSAAQSLNSTSTAQNLSSTGLSNYNLNTLGPIDLNLSSTSTSAPLRTSSYNLNTISSPSTPGPTGYNIPSTTVGSSGYNLSTCQVASTIEDVIRMHSTPSPTATSSGLSTPVIHSLNSPQLLHSLLSKQLNKRKSDPADQNSPVKKKRAYTRRKTTVATTSTTNTVPSVISDISFAQNQQNQINNQQIVQIENQTKTNESINQSLTFTEIDSQHQTTKDNNESTNQQTVDNKSQTQTNQFDSNKRLLVPSSFQIENQNRTKINESTNQQTIFQTKIVRTNELTNVDSLMSTLLASTGQIENQNKTKINESAYQQFQASCKINNKMITNARRPIGESTQNLLPTSLPSTSVMKTKIDVHDSLNKESMKLKSNDSINVDLMSTLLPSIDHIQTKTSNQQFLVPSMNKINEIETKINESTINKQFLLPSMNEIKNQIETKKNESTSKSLDSTKLFDDDDDDFQGFDNLQIEKTISEIEANIKELENFSRELERNSTAVGSIAPSTSFSLEQEKNATNSIASLSNFSHEQEKKPTAVDSIAPSTSFVDDTKNDQQMKQVIEILEKQSDLIATELSNDCERNVPKTQQNVIKSSIESTNKESNVIVTTADTKPTEIFETRYHHKQVYQNNIISQIDFSDLLKSTDSAETKHKNSEFDNLFKNLDDDQQHSMKATDENQPTHSKSDQVLHSDNTNNDNELKLSPKFHFYKFSYHKTMEVKKSANLKFLKVESAEVNETKEKEETKVIPSVSSTICGDSSTKFFSSVSEKEKFSGSSNPSKKLTDNKPKTAVSRSTSEKLTNTKPKPIISPVLSLEDSKTKTAWPSPLIGSKDLFENLLTKEKETTKVIPSVSSTICGDSSTKFFSSVSEKEKLSGSSNSSKKLTDNKPKTAVSRSTSEKLTYTKPKPIISPVLSLEDSKTKSGWPSPLKESKDLFENLLSTIDQVEPSKFLTNEEIPLQPPKVFSSFLEYSKDEDPARLRIVSPAALDISSKNEIPIKPPKVFSSFLEYSKDEDPTRLRVVSPAALDITSKNDECDFFRNDPSENAGTNKVTTFSEALKSLSEEINRKSSDFSSMNASPRKVIKDTEEIPEKPAQLQSDKKLSFTNFFNKTPQKNKDRITFPCSVLSNKMPCYPISDNTETSKDVSVSKNFEAKIDKPTTEPRTSSPIPKIVETKKVTKPPEKVSDLENFRSTEVANKPQSITKPTVATKILKVANKCEPIMIQTVVSSDSQVKPILTLKTTGCKIQEPSKFITALKVSVAQTSSSEIKLASSTVTTESKPSGLTLTSLANSMRLVKEGNEYRLVSIPITTQSTTSTTKSETSCIRTIQSMITEAIKKKQKETAAQKLQHQETIHSKSVTSNATKTPNTTTLPLKVPFEGQLKSILKTPINVSKTPATTPQTVYSTKILTTPTNVIKPGTSVCVNNRSLTVKSIIVAPANILTSNSGTHGTKLGNITVLTTTPVTTSNTKPTDIQVKSVAQTENTKSTPIIKPRASSTPLILKKNTAKPLTTFTNSLKIAQESETIKQVPKYEKSLNLPPRKSPDPVVNIIESDDNIEILEITNPSSKSSSPTTFTNILKNQKLKYPPSSKNSPPSPLSIEYENHEGVKQTVLIKTNKKFGSNEQIQSKSSDSQSSSSSSNELDFTVVRTSNGYQVKRTIKSNSQVAKTVKIEYINQNNDVPDLVPFSSSSKCTELGKHKLISENRATSLGTKRFKNNDADEGCSGTADSQQNLQESTGGVQQQQNNSSAATNNVSVQQTTTVPSLSTIVTSPNIVQNSLNTTNGSTVSVVRSTSAIISHSTTLSSPNTDTPTLVNMLIHRPAIRTNQEVPGAASSAAAARLKQIYQSTVEDDSSVTVNSTPVSVSNIIRATGVTANQAPASIQVRGATSTSGTPHLLSFVNSSQLLKSISTSDGVKPLQLLYKISDGKTYITPVSLSASSSVKMATVNKQQTGEIVKVEVISPTSKLTPTSTSASTARSVFEETYAKFIHIGRTNQTHTVNSVSSSASESTTSSTSSTLPKFQQAFGKTTNFSNSQTTRNTDQQPLLLVSKMSGGASVVSVSSAPPSVTSTITSTTSTPITVVPVSIGTSVATSTIQRVTTHQQQVRLIKTTSSTTPASNNNKPAVENKNECNDVDSNTSNDSLPPSSASQTVSIQQSGQTSQTVLTPMRLTLPIVQRTGGIPTTRVMTPVLLRQRVLLTSGAVGTPIRLPQNARVLTSNMNTLEPSVSSSTLEQLREFDKVFEKVKERSTTVQPATSVTATTVTATVPSTTVSTVSTNFINKIENSNTTADTSDDSTQTSNRSSTPIMATFQTAPHIDTSNLVVGTQQQRVSVAYVSGQLGQTILSSPLVVMQQQPMSMSMASSTPSPALSVTSQSSSSSPSSSSNANNNPISSSKSTPIKLNATVTSVSATAAASKTIKNKPIKPNTQASPLKASPVPKPQQKPQEDEGTAQRIYSILAEYAEQLRNSPDLNNKPAPRRRSNPPANPSQNSKRKKSSGGKKVSTSSGGTGSGMEMSPGTVDDHRTIGSEDSSCGVQLHLSQLQDSPSQAMLSMDDAQSTEGSMDIPGMRGLHGMDNSNDCMDRPSSSQSASAVSVSASSVSVPTSNAHQTPQHRQLILTDTSNSTGNRNVIITDSVVSEALAQVGKITNTATVLVPGNYLLPMSMVKGGHQITIVSGGSKILAVKPLKLPTTISNNQTAAGTSQQITTQVLVPTSNAQKISTQLLNRTMVSSSEASLIRTSQTATGILSMADGIHNRDHSNSLDFSSSGAVLTVQSSNTKNNATLAETNNTNHRNTAHQLQLQVNDPTPMSGSNGPLLSQLCNELNDNGNHSSGIILTDTSSTNVINVSPIHNGKVDRDCIDNTKNSFKKNWSNNGDTIDQHHQSGASPIFRHSPGMQYATSTIDTTQPDKKSRTINNNNQKQLSIQAQRKQAAIERELRLQKSLSEECEDLGVDEPSASDLFPEAEILFDNTNQSPSFGGNVLLQDVVTTTCSNDDENIFTNTLDNGSSRDMTTTSSQDIKNKLNDHIDYLLVQKNKINKNGTTKFHGNVVAQCSNSSQSSYEDTNTLITNTPLISDVTIPSPLPQSTSYCLPSPYRAESPLTQATHSHLYTYSKKSNTKLATKKGRSYSLFESDCELSSSSHDDSNSRTSSTSADGKDNDSLSDSASEAQSDNNTRKYSRKRPYKLYVYDENGVDASSFTCDKDETHETSTHLNNTPSSDNNEESMSAMSADMMEGLLEDSSESSPHSMLSDSDLASLSSGLRRASKRGHVRKGCPCCTTAQDTSSPPTKRKFGKKAFTQHGHAATKKIGGKKIS